MDWDTYSQAMSRVGLRIRNTPFDYHVYTHSFPQVLFKGRGKLLPTWQGEAVWMHPTTRVNWVPVMIVCIVACSVVIGYEIGRIVFHRSPRWWEHHYHK